MCHIFTTRLERMCYDKNNGGADKYVRGEEQCAVIKLCCVML